MPSAEVAGDSEQPQGLMQKLPPFLTEFYGTFFLTLTVALVFGTVDLSHNNTTPALAVGMVLAILVYGGGHISGAHYNPAVTLGVVLRGKLPPMVAGLYLVSQFLAGMIAGVIGNYVNNKLVYPGVGDSFSVGQAVLVEILYTFLLVTIVLSTATSKAVLNNGWFGLSIGMAVFVGVSVTGHMSGAALNPAVGLGLHFGAFCADGREDGLNKYKSDDWWVYLVAPLVGGMFAAAWYRLTSPSEFGFKKTGKMPAKGHVHTNLNTSDPTKVSGDVDDVNQPLRS